MNVPCRIVLRHAHQVATNIDVVVGVYRHGLGQRVALHLVGHASLRTGVGQSLDAVVFDVEDEIVRNIHVQLGKNHRDFPLSIPVVQFPENLAMDGVFVFNHRTFLHVRHGKLQLIVMFVNLLRCDAALLHACLRNLAAFQIEGCSLDILHILVGIGTEDTFRHRTRLFAEVRITAHAVHRNGGKRSAQSTDVVANGHEFLIGHDDLCKACTAGLQHLDAHLLVIVYQITVGLHRVFHFGQSAQHYGFGIRFGIVHGHLHFFLGWFTPFHVHVGCTGCCKRECQQHE